MSEMRSREIQYGMRRIRVLHIFIFNVFNFIFIISTPNKLQRSNTPAFQPIKLSQS